MILQVMALYDSKARAYRAPFFVSHMDVGFRAVQGAVNEVGHELAKYAEDFSLWHMGEFDDVSGNFSLKQQPMNLGCILQLKKPESVGRKVDYETEMRPYKANGEVPVLPLSKEAS